MARALADFGLSQIGFARSCGISHSFVSAVCRGESYPSVELLRGLHNRGVRLGWILVGDEGEYIVPPTAAPAAPLPHWADDLRPAHHRAYQLVDAVAARRSVDFVEGLLTGLASEDTRASRSRTA